MDSYDVVVVGAGLAGLSAAELLVRADLDVSVVEASDAVGGRVRTDQVDGMLLDRGFQVLLPGYPEVRSRIDLEGLDPRPFVRGLLLVDGDDERPLGDPRDVFGASANLLPGRALSGLDLARVAAMTARDLALPASRLVAGPDRTTRHELGAHGISATAIDRVFAPFLRGVFLDGELATSGRYFHLVWRSFLRAAPVLPALGMAQLPRQLAARLPERSIQLNRPVGEVDQHEVRLTDGDVLRARAVVVATDGTTAARLVPGIAEPSWHGVTTYYFAAADVPGRRGMLTVDAAADGPVVNTVVTSDVARGYAPGRALVSASVLGTPRSSEAAEAETAVRRHLARLYRTETARWDLVRAYPIERAVPALPVGSPMRRPVRGGLGVYVCGDHRDTPSVQGALFSGRRAAEAVLADLDVTGGVEPSGRGAATRLGTRADSGYGGGDRDGGENGQERSAAGRHHAA